MSVSDPDSAALLYSTTVPWRFGSDTPVGRTDDSSFLVANRIVIESVHPEIDGGRFPAKCVVREPVTIEADVFGDGHYCVQASVLYRAAGTGAWSELPMEVIEGDRRAVTVFFEENRLYQFTVIAWRDKYATWHRETRGRHAAGESVGLELEEGCQILRAAMQSGRGKPRDSAELVRVLEVSANLSDETERLSLLTSDSVSALARRTGLRLDLSRYDRILEIFADRRLAAFSAWYELFPRSQSGDPTRHGTFDDVIARLPYIRDLGFDVLYLPPIHPIGTTNRKGRNNSLRAEPEDVGSPYAIGSAEGGHDAIHPELGDLDDFDRLVAAARDCGLEIALDFAVQCSPDHPWIKAYPEWFEWRPDGSIRFAENPPKKYQDIVNVNFYAGDTSGLWHALRDIFLFYIERGVRIFRVDNPHTKPFPFWEWVINDVRNKHPSTIFLSEAFTRLKRMKRLAKIGFSQTYSDFIWRNGKSEIQEYMAELTLGEARHYLRPNFFANTPDINPPYLQQGGRPGFQIRLVLAGTLGGNYGIYNGFEICETRAGAGVEDYLDSEMYQLRAWDMDQPDNIGWDIRFVNRIRKNYKSLQQFDNFTFYNAWNDNILYYGKRARDLSDFLLFHVCLDPHNDQHSDFEVPLWEFGLPDHASMEVEDLVTGRHMVWHGKHQHIHLNPLCKPYAIWRLCPPGA